MKDGQSSTTGSKQTFERLLSQVVSAPFSGWDFSYLCHFGGMPNDPFPWSYDCVVREYLKDAKALLDIGTGGGEKLSEFQPLPPETYATEAYKPNVTIAKQRLGPLGVKVIEVEEGVQEQSPLPFKNAFFDLVIDRHECFETKEVYRVLKKQGVFITQQVGSQNLAELRSMLNATGTGITDDDAAWNLQNLVRRLTETGFEVLIAKEHLGFSRFYDIRTIVYLAKNIPWDFPGFSVERCNAPLYEIYKHITTTGYFDSKCHRYFLIVQKKEI